MNNPHPTAFILGSGISGVAAARLLKAKGYAVTVIDEAPEETFAETARQLRAEGIEVESGKWKVESGKLGNRELSTFHFPPSTFAVVSPGMPPTAALFADAVRKGIPIISELDVGAYFLNCPMIAVTGSKGKSSLVKLIADTLTLAGHPALPCGNYGTALSELGVRSEELGVCSTSTTSNSSLLTPNYLEWAVVECSSFQLETVKQFHPRIGIFLNLSPDHLDRHGTMEEYRDVKLRMFNAECKMQNAEMESRKVEKSNDVAEVGDVEKVIALLPSGADPYNIRARFKELYPEKSFETFGTEPDADWQYLDGKVICNLPPSRHPAVPPSPIRHSSFSILHSYFANPILGRAAAAAVAALCHAGLSAEEIERGFASFTPLDHRMQLVGEWGGVRFINDSKATSLAAQMAALKMLNAPVRLIAGGRLKEKNITDAKELVTNGVQKVYLIGESAKVLKTAWSPTLSAEECGTLADAVRHAARDARPGEVVLLSPGTASFDQFQNYQFRGQVFTDLVKHLHHEGKTL